MSKASAVVAGFALVVLSLGSASEAQAQFARGGRVQTFVGAGGPVTLTPGAGYAPAGYVGAYPAAPTTVVGSSYASGYAGRPSFPYSYYAAQPGTMPREYVGLPNTTDFPYNGQAYGHPYDRWTWPYLANPDRGLSRYYYQILK